MTQPYVRLRGAVNDRAECRTRQPDAAQLLKMASMLAVAIEW
jgi:hypothetical protein